MNIKKGMERIALIIAIVAIVPGLFLGVEFVSDKCRTETPEYKAWLKKTEELYPNWNNRGNKIRGFLPEELEMPWPPYKDPPIWQLALGSVVVASLSFFIVLFGIRGTTRLVIWVVGGFRDKSEEVSTTIANSKDKQSP